MSLTPQQKGPPPRPKQIAYAVYFIVSAIVISALLQVTAVLTTGQESGGYYADPLNLLCLGAAHLISLYVALMIALGKSWARILFLIGFALEFINAVMEAGGNLDNLFVTALLAFTTILDVIAIYLLYRPASSAWFEARKAYEAAQMAGDDGQAEEGASPAAAGAEQAPGVDLPVGKAVIMAGGVGALLGLLNGLFWTVSLPPQSAGERGLIYFLLLSGVAAGALLGLLLGFTLLQIARRDPKRDAVRWALMGGALGGMVSFGCGFAAMVLSFA